MSYFRSFAAKIRKNEKTKARQIHSLSYLRIFVFSNLCGEETKIRQNKCDNTSDKMCRVFALHLSYLRFFVSSPRRLEKTKARQIHSLSYLRIVVFSSLCGEETNTRQNKCNNTTDKMCRVFALNLSYLRFFVSSYFRFVVFSRAGFTTMEEYSDHCSIFFTISSFMYGNGPTVLTQIETDNHQYPLSNYVSRSKLIKFFA